MAQPRLNFRRFPHNTRITCIKSYIKRIDGTRDVVSKLQNLEACFVLNRRVLGQFISD